MQALSFAFSWCVSNITAYNTHYLTQSGIMLVLQFLWSWRMFWGLLIKHDSQHTKPNGSRVMAMFVKEMCKMQTGYFKDQSLNSYSYGMALKSNQIRNTDSS